VIRTIQIIKTAHFTFFFSKITTYAQYIADVEHILFYDLRIFVKNKYTFLFYLSKKNYLFDNYGKMHYDTDTKLFTSFTM